MRLLDLVPDADGLLALESADLGMILLKIIQADHAPRTTPSKLEMPLWEANTTAYPHSKRAAVGHAFAEAWQWLQNEGLLMPDLDQPNGWFYLTRKGERIKTAEDIGAYRQGNLLPISLLHHVLVETVRPLFLRGDYETAVFKAFKEVEVAVRDTAEFPNDVIGVQLMRRAFHPTDGPLSNADNVTAEREALMHLYSGAIGHAKNPPSHRDIEMKRVSAAQLIIFASYLLDQLEGFARLEAAT